MISLPIPMALESFLQADILNILLHRWEKNSKGRSSFKFMTRLLLHQRESYSALAESYSGIAVSELPHMSRGKTWRSLIVPEHLTMLRATWCPNKPRVGSQAGDTSDSPAPAVSELTEPPLTCKRHPAPSRQLCSSPSQKPAGRCLWLWSAPHSTAQGLELPWIGAVSTDVTRSEAITNT